MGVFDWDPVRFDVGVAAMNDQHKGLIDLMNKIWQRHQAGARKAELLALITELAGLTQKHFAEEEAFTQSIAFPTFAGHKRIHDKLLRDFGAHVAAFEASGELGDAFFDFLSLWLRSHICHVDTKYGEHEARLAG